MTQWNYCPQCMTALTKDALGNPTCPQGHFTRYSTPVAATLAFVRNNNEYLILQRNNEPQKGWWDLPGGFVDPNETSDQTIIREIEEETGMTKFTSLTFIGSFPSRYGDLDYTLAAGYVIDVDNRDIRLSEENTAYKWVKLEDIPELAFADTRTALAQLKAQNTPQ